MTEVRFNDQAGTEPGEQPVRKPWQTPHIILSELAGANAGSNVNTDAPLVSQTC